MLDRRTLGEISPKPHTVFNWQGKPVSELVLSRDGFSGGFSILYQESPPTSIRSLGFAQQDISRFLGKALPPQESPLARRHIRSWEAPEGRDFFSSRTALYLNEHCRMSTCRGEISLTEGAFCHGDADELYFVYEGSGTFQTLFGRLSFRKHDYVLIPRGTAYRICPEERSELFCIEGSPALQIPDDFRNPFGQLKMEAPYTHRDFRSPEDLLTKNEADHFRKISTLKNGQLSLHEYSQSPARTIGWDGSVYPLAFNIHDYLPKTGKIHLPPNLHLTFQNPYFVVCSFVPRMVDYLEGAIPCPYPHANVGCDEILYYVSGDFTSRSGISPRSLSFHPAGLPHGPQPGNYLKSVGSHKTDELAVMVDTWEPLLMTEAAGKLEDPDYALSWA